MGIGLIFQFDAIGGRLDVVGLMARGQSHRILVDQHLFFCLLPQD
jgi:hypothetical protein